MLNIDFCQGGSSTMRRFLLNERFAGGILGLVLHLFLQNDITELLLCGNTQEDETKSHFVSL